MTFRITSNLDTFGSWSIYYGRQT